MQGMFIDWIYTESINGPLQFRRMWISLMLGDHQIRMRCMHRPTKQPLRSAVNIANETLNS